MAEYPICIGGKQAGRLYVQRQGLYTLFTARAQGTEPLALWLYGPGGRALLGRMLPRCGELFLARKLSRGDMRGFPPVIEYAGDARPERTDAAPETASPSPDRLWYRIGSGALFCPEEGLVAFPARLRNKSAVFSHIRVINGREYLVFRR